MRPTPKLALALTRPHKQAQAQANLAWLSSLKSNQLQTIARATGIQSSGTKSILSARIEAALAPYLTRHQHGHAGSLLEAGRGGRDQPLSILSIDMGIQNMAFAVLRVPRRSSSSSGSGPGPGSESSARALSLSTPELLAWRRLAVSEIEGLGLDLGESVGSVHLAQSKLTQEDSPLTSTKKGTTAFQTHLPTTATSKSSKQKEGKETFSPALYAKTAYTLITTLLQTYNPTHILIERQRFRSGGASAVQEWTLRVGVLEGMLYAVLETLRREGCLGFKGEVVQVHGVEPKRVVGFWESVVAGGESGGVGGRKRVSAREVKKGKIDLVGRWLDASFPSSSSSLSESGIAGGDGRIVIPEENTVVRELAGAYLRRWRGENGRRRKDSSAGGSGEIGKLDDLADCLLQGVTWLEWQVMRERFASEGVEALKGCGS